jgi:ribosomal protein S18 acetylase RimI-like enzyme
MMSHIVRWPKTLKSSLIGRNPLKRAFSLNYHNDNAELSASSRHEQPINHPHELYTVRVAQTYDIPAIKAANRANLPENYSPEFFSRHLQLWPALSLVAECDGVLIGYALGRVELVAQPAPTGTSVPYPCVRLVRPHRQPVGHVTSVAVNDDFRGFGVGKALMTALHNHLDTEHNVVGVALHVRVSNTTAIKLYADSFQYEVAEVCKAYYEDGEDAYVMKRRSASTTNNIKSESSPGKESKI